MKQTILLLLLPGMLFFTACKKDKKTNTDPCPTDNMSFAEDILPIFKQSCATAGCHDAGNMAAGIRLDNYDGVKAQLALTLQAIKHEAGTKPMPYPPGSEKLPDCEISKIEAWITQGAEDN